MSIADESKKSRILTLVFTDLADSTALKTERGDQEVGDLILRHRECITRLCEECSGRVIDWAGDGCFLTFETSSAAVTFALRLQQTHAEEPDLPGVRVGLHMGEITERPGPDGEEGRPRVEGLAVDLAARISGLAKPGQVLMSSAVYNSARQRLGVKAFGQPILWQAHGTYNLKGFDEPLGIAEAGLEGLSPLQAPEAVDKASPTRAPSQTDPVNDPGMRNTIPMALALIAVLGVVAAAFYFGQRTSAPSEGQLTTAFDAVGPITSLAVLPLNSLSDDQEQEYFAYTLTEAIIIELAKIKSLKVISRTSIVRYKDTDLSMPEIAAELGVDGLIEGSVLRDGDEVRVTAQLIHGPSDTHLWGETYTNTITGVMQLQSEVALAIADAIDATVTGDERRRISAAREVNREAYDAYIIGNHYFNDISKEGLFTAIEHFEEAVKIDPDFAHAWGGMVCAYWELAAAGLVRPREIFPKARAAGIRALQLNDDQSTDQSHLGMISMGYDYEWEQAEERFLHALGLSPSDSVPHGDYAHFLVLVGRAGEALQHAATSLDLDPKPAIFSWYLGLESMYLESNPERVRRNLERLLVEEPEYLRTLESLTRTYKYLGMHNEAIAAAEKWVEQADSDASALTNLAQAYADAGRKDRAREVIEKIREVEDYFDSAGVGYAHVPLDNLDAAFDWLEKGYDSRDWAMTRLRTIPYWKIYLDDPSWIGFRNDPRYRDLVARMNFPPLPPEHAGYADEQAWKAQKAAAEAANAPIRKIAVLPFENMSSDPEQEYFVDGMTEALISELAKIKSLKVISRTSTMRYKNTDKSLTQIARELGVDALVEGSVFKAGDSVRITAQLIHGVTDEHLWAGDQTAKLEDVLNLQAEVALFIADEIHATVTPEERSRIASKKTIDPEAYALYAQGRHFWNRRDAEGFEKARGLFEQALEIDPGFLEARVGLADCYALPALHGFLDPDVGFPRAELEVRRVLDEDPTLGEAHATLGLIQLNYSWDWSAAEASLRRAIELSPNYGGAYDWYSDYLLMVGRYEGSLEYDRKGLELDPLSPEQASDVGVSLMMSGQIESSITFMLETVNLYPDVPLVHLTLGDALSTSGAFEEALRHYERAVEQTDRASLQYVMPLVLAYADLGRTEEARALLEELEEEYRESGYGALVGFAMCRANFGEWDEAFEWYEEAFRKHDFVLSRLRNDADHSLPPDFVADPRFQELLRRMNYPER